MSQATNSGQPAAPLGADLIMGIDKIAAELGESERRILYLLGKRQLPGGFKLGGRWYLSRSAFTEATQRMARGEAA